MAVRAGLAGLLSMIAIIRLMIAKPRSRSGDMDAHRRLLTVAAQERGLGAAPLRVRRSVNEI
jgi:hypothetical protein